MRATLLAGACLTVAACSAAPPSPAPCPRPSVSAAPAPPTVAAPAPSQSSIPLAAASASPSSVEPGFGPMPGMPGLFSFGDAGGEGQCGAFQIVSHELHGGLGLTVHDSSGQVVTRLVPQLGIDSYYPSVCGDLNGDGTMDVLVQYSTGGAHCCHTEMVLTLEPAPKILLARDMGDGGHAVPVKLDGSKGYPLLLRDMILVEAALPVPFAGIPALPMILEWDGTKYVDGTKHHSAFVRARRDDALREVECDRDDEGCQEVRGALAAAYARLIGDWAAQRAKLAPPAQRSGDRILSWLVAAAR